MHSPNPWVGEAHAYVQGATLKAWALSAESFELPDSYREMKMLRAVYFLGSLIAITATALALVPVVLFAAASKLWDLIELHAVYGGDATARDKDRWRLS